MNHSAVQDFLMKIFSTAFGCPHRCGTAKMLRIFSGPRRLIADEGIPHIAIIPKKVIHTSLQSAGVFRGVFTATEGRGKLEKNPIGFFE